VAVLRKVVHLTAVALLLLIMLLTTLTAAAVVQAYTEATLSAV
jgi:hypothetical protein